MVLKIHTCQHHAVEFLRGILRHFQLIAGFVWPPRQVLDEQVILSKPLSVSVSARGQRRSLGFYLEFACGDESGREVQTRCQSWLEVCSHSHRSSRKLRALGGKRVRDLVVFLTPSDSVFGPRCNQSGVLYWHCCGGLIWALLGCSLSHH